MGIEVVSILVGGESYTAFESIAVRAAFNEAARSFKLEIAAELGASATNNVFNVGAKVQIFANGEKLLDGYVDRKQPSFGAKQAKISISGRSKSGDLIDGSAEHETGRFENKDPVEIGNEIASDYEAKFESDQELEKIEQYQITPGESCYRCIEKMAREQGLTLAGTADGNINITKAGSKRQAGGLIEGANILTGTADHNGSNRHSKYVVRGQRPFGHGVKNLEIEALCKDTSVDRHRTCIIVQDEDTTPDRAKKRAKNRRDRAAGNALKATIETQGFRDETGGLWTPGALVWVESRFLDIAQDMLIESADFRQDEGGSITSLALTDPRSYGGKGGKGNKSGSDWEQDDSEAEDDT